MSEAQKYPPVIAIDGPSASGKGTLAKRVADCLGFYYLDSGAIYRALAKAATQKHIAFDDEKQLAQLAQQIDLVFTNGEILLDGQDVSQEIRGDEIGIFASKIAGLGTVRSRLLERQRAFRQWPGLVADGRDMASVVFPDAALKVFLTASVEVRALRRYNQLNLQGVCVSLDEISAELAARDQRDYERSESPLCRADDAFLMDNSDLTIDQCVKMIIDSWHEISDTLQLN